MNADDFLATAPLLPLEMAPDGRVRFVGEQAVDLLGLPRNAWMTPDFWAEHVVPDDFTALRETRAAAARGVGSGRVDYRLQHASGGIVWVWETVRRVDGPEGPVLRGYLADITDRKRQEVAVWKSDERARALLRSAPDALVLTDIEGRILDMNDQAEALFAYRINDVVGSSFDHLMPPRLRSRLPELRAAFDRDPQRRSLVDGHGLSIERSDGTAVPVELSMSLVTAEDGTRQLLCSVRDLTVRRRAEAKARSSERRLREMANAVPAMVCFVDRDNRYRFVNDAYAHWYGWERHQMEGRLVREVVGERIYTDMQESIEAALSGTPTHFRGELRGPSPERVPVDVSMVPQHDEHDQVTGYFVVVFDVTPEVAAREADRRHRRELAHVSRVATLGELAASIAHELNQPLSAIVANAQAARRFLDTVPPELDEVSAALADIAAAGTRAGDVISSMRALLQRGEVRDESVDVAGLANEVVELLHSEAIGRGVSVATIGTDGPAPLVRGDPIQLTQVLLNLIMKAIEAASRSPSGSRRVVVEVSVPGQEVEVSVRDSGPGLPTPDPEELFAPFVTRRTDGLGMGLAIARSIAEAHDGRVWAEDHPDGGAVFRLRLPGA